MLEYHDSIYLFFRRKALTRLTLGEELDAWCCNLFITQFIENLVRPCGITTHVGSCHARYDLLDTWYKSHDASSDLTYVKSTNRVQAL
jgi:hypothetical protein